MKADIRSVSNETWIRISLLLETPGSFISITGLEVTLGAAFLNSADVFYRNRLLYIRQDRGWIHCGVPRIYGCGVNTEGCLEFFLNRRDLCSILDLGVKNKID